jgi:superfamily II DNA or RNA helicase
MNKFNEIIKTRGLTELPYQKDFLTNPIYDKVSKPVVFAAGTSAGKTFTMAMWLEIFYSNIKNKNKLTLIIPASKTVLRDNTKTSLEEFNPSFTYAICKDKKELETAINDGIQVIIALPQTLIRSIDILPQVDRFILDEAHQWYFKTTIQSLIKKVKPNYQLLLTGSPSRFVAQSDRFICKFVPVMELYELGHVHNAKLEVVSSSYDFKQSDWLSSYGNLKSSKTNSPIKAKQALEMVIDEMITKLKSTTSSKITRNWKGINKVNSFFNHLSKTIIYTHSTKQADTFFKILDKKMKGSVLLSHSENDGKSELFVQFQKDDNIRILIAVDRGRLGFNMPELFNIVDFTMTQSLDMLLQMYGRLLRKSSDNPTKQKIYFKVATKNTADYFVDLMTGMLCLTTNDEPTYYYSSYNGKNMGGIRIPKAVMNKKRVKAHTPSKSAKSTGTKPYVSLVELGIPSDLNLFKQSALHSSDGYFESIAWTTLDEVRKEFFNLKTGNDYTNDELYEMALKFNKRVDFKNFNNIAYRQVLDRKLDYKFFSHMESTFNKKVILNTKQDVKNYVMEKGFKKISDVMPVSLRRKIKKLGLTTKLFPNTWLKNDISNKELEEIVSKMKEYKEFYNSEYFGIARYRNLVNNFKEKYFKLGKYDNTKWKNMDLNKVIDFCKKFENPYHLEKDNNLYNFCGIETKAKPILRIAQKNNLFDTIWPNRTKVAKKINYEK